VVPEVDMVVDFIVLMMLAVNLVVFRVLILQVEVVQEVQQMFPQHQVEQVRVEIQVVDVVMAVEVEVEWPEEIMVPVQMVEMVVLPEVVEVEEEQEIWVMVVMEVQEVEEKLEYILGKKNIIWQ
jgi:hypothetical protein